MYDGMKKARIEEELDRLYDERHDLEKYSMVDDPDGEWDQVSKEISALEKKLNVIEAAEREGKSTTDPL